MLELTGQIEKITFASEETGFTIAKVRPDDSTGLITVVGNLLSPPEGSTMKMLGEWSQHPQFGRQFKVSQFQSIIPVTTAGIKKYLGSGLISGLGEKMAGRIVKKFGDKTLEIIGNDIERLSEVEGIGKKRISLIQKAWDDQKEIRDVMVFLQSYGVSTGFATKIFKQYQGRSIEVVKENPYCLATDIIGIGFKTADTIASNIGFAADSPFRIRAGLIFILRKINEDGHVFCPQKTLVDECIRLLGVDKPSVLNAVNDLAAERKIIIEELDGTIDFLKEDPVAVYPAPYYFCETGVVKHLVSLINGLKPVRQINVEKEIELIQQRFSLSLAPKQIEAVKTAVEAKAMVITGGPGTGKTTIINAILKIFSKYNKRILLTAPTGRAAKRMAETTGFTAKTIHRLLEFSFKMGGFVRNDENLLHCDVLIVDEASMIDINLMFHLLKAVPDSAVLILVGDVNQLPSVGAGNVLNDIIDSNVLPVVRLTEIFRQAKESKIVVNAHKINAGQLPGTGNFTTGDDYYFIETTNPEKVVDTIVELVKNRIPRRFNYDPFTDIQILTPMHKGITGSENLNTLLQEKINPVTKCIKRGDKKFKIHDKVMQIRNNYDKDVFNGDIGRINAIDSESSEVVVRFDGRDINYGYSELDEIILAYAISVHKSQGSEYPVVVMPVTTQHYILLQRNLIYTGVTRGKELVVLVGTKKALMMGIKNNQTSKRFTYLKNRLRENSAQKSLNIL